MTRRILHALTLVMTVALAAPALPADARGPERRPSRDRADGDRSDNGRRDEGRRNDRAQPARARPAQPPARAHQPPRARPAAPPARAQPPRARPAAPPARAQPPRARPAEPPARAQPPRARPAEPPARAQPPRARPAAPPARAQPPRARPAAPPARAQPPRAQPRRPTRTVIVEERVHVHRPARTTTTYVETHHHHHAAGAASHTHYRSHEPYRYEPHHRADGYLTLGLGASALSPPAGGPLFGSNLDLGLGVRGRVLATGMHFTGAGYLRGGTLPYAGVSLYGLGADLKVQPALGPFEPYVFVGLGAAVASDRMAGTVALGGLGRAGFGADLRHRNAALGLRYTYTGLALPDPDRGLAASRTDSVGLNLSLYF
jgi:hypothetical protein